ncbi:MAG: hypothetical protein ABR561_00275 [Guyparkeria sp.]
MIRSDPGPGLSKGLRVDREAALGWLGIEGFRPSGRVRPLPWQPPVAGEPSSTDVASAHPPVEPQPVGQEAQVDAPAETPSAAVEQAGDGPGHGEGYDLSHDQGHDHGNGDIDNHEATDALASTTPADTSIVSDRVCVSAGSAYRALAEAIAPVAGLACETGEGTSESNDVVILAGEHWDLATIAADGPAKRRLWQALVARGRRPRG